MQKLLDLAGQTFGDLYVIGRVEDHIMPCGQKKTQYLCECKACGRQLNLTRNRLVIEKITHCGCRKDRAKSALAKKNPEKCLHNPKGVICYDADCSKCGWNPENTELREKRLAKIKERVL